ncbi:MAG TPA: Glu/Leu/Phe/Val dehydrogenase dimerization domain-containing protein [Thermoanaerobaculia bacterium]|nr:Glu/Leu/Phe/Val dehydrogenase dimerization domain-containing protein [Thermoanaerobaculia bacterium]
MWEALGNWSGETLHARHDHATGTLMLVAIHRAGRGRAGGGTRMKCYGSREAAVADALALAEAMTYKWALAGIPIGGAKAVLAVPPDLDPAARLDLLRRYGSFVASLRGAFGTGPDVGTTPEDMDVIAETGGEHVSSRASQGIEGGSTAPTAVGVLAGIRAAIAHVFGEAPLAERTFAIQGLGGVGSRVAAALAAEGSRVIVCDVDGEAVRRTCEGSAIEEVAPDTIYDVACDLFAPCALGGVLNAETIPRLRCRIVAGAANNQLGADDGARRLDDRGILYAPDFAVNAGGVIGVVGVESYGWSEERARAEVEARITRNLAEIFALAESESIDTESAARRLALERLEDSE